MEKKKINVFLIIILVVLAIVLIPWRKINWGKVQWLQAETVTVNGEAKSKQKNQIATFTAGVDALKDNKDDAIKEVNTKVEALIKAVKDFGIDESDIKTQNMSVYQQEESYYDGGVQKMRKGQWRVNNSIEIVLRQVDKASELTNLLTGSGANNVYGPNFSFEDTNQAEKDLFEAAMKDAKEKAEMLAKASGRKLGKVVNINETVSGVNYSLMSAKVDGMGGGGMPAEAGSTTVSKSLTVSFELE